MITKSLIPLETILPDEYAFIIGVDQNEVLAGSIAYRAPFKFFPTHQYKENKGLPKRYGN